MAGGTIDDDFPRARDLAGRLMNFAVGTLVHLEIDRDECRVVGNVLHALLDQASSEDALRTKLQKERADNIAVNAELTRERNLTESLRSARDFATSSLREAQCERDTMKKQRDEERVISATFHRQIHELSAKQPDEMTIANLRSELAYVKGQLDAKQTAEHEAKFRHERLVTTARMFLASRLQGGLRLTTALVDDGSGTGPAMAFRLAKQFWSEADGQV